MSQFIYVIWPLETEGRGQLTLGEQRVLGTNVVHK